jgi:hypothetical protein
MNIISFCHFISILLNLIGFRFEKDNLREIGNTMFVVIEWILTIKSLINIVVRVRALLIRKGIIKKIKELFEKKEINLSELSTEMVERNNTFINDLELRQELPKDELDSIELKIKSKNRLTL